MPVAHRVFIVERRTIQHFERCSRGLDNRSLSHRLQAFGVCERWLYRFVSYRAAMESGTSCSVHASIAIMGGQTHYLEI